MEYPMEPFKKDGAKRLSTPHIDSVIFIFHNNKTSIIYIEAKRITENFHTRKYQAIIDDIDRMQRTNNREYIKNSDYLLEKASNTKNIDEYICYLSDVWVGGKKHSPGVPVWWHNSLPQLTSLSSNRTMFHEQIKRKGTCEYAPCSYDLLGLITKL